MSFNKLQAVCEKVYPEIIDNPFVREYGVYKDGKDLGIAIITNEPDGIDDGWLEITEEEKSRLKKIFKPVKIQFFSNPMLTFSEWLGNNPKKKSPIIAKVFRNY